MIDVQDFWVGEKESENPDLELKKGYRRVLCDGLQRLRMEQRCWEMIRRGERMTQGSSGELV